MTKKFKTQLENTVVHVPTQPERDELRQILVDDGRKFYLYNDLGDYVRVGKTASRRSDDVGSSLHAYGEGEEIITLPQFKEAISIKEKPVKPKFKDVLTCMTEKFYLDFTNEEIDGEPIEELKQQRKEINRKLRLFRDKKKQYIKTGVFDVKRSK